MPQMSSSASSSSLLQLQLKDTRLGWGAKVNQAEPVLGRGWCMSVVSTEVST